MAQPVVMGIAYGAKILFIIFLIALFVGLGLSAQQNATHWLMCVAVYGLIIASVMSKITRAIGSASFTMYPVTRAHSQLDNIWGVGGMLNVLT